MKTPAILVCVPRIKFLLVLAGLCGLGGLRVAAQDTWNVANGANVTGGFFVWGQYFTINGAGFVTPPGSTPVSGGWLLNPPTVNGLHNGDNASLNSVNASAWAIIGGNLTVNGQHAAFGGFTFGTLVRQPDGSGPV